MKEVFKLWEDTPGMCEEIPVIEYINLRLRIAMQLL